MKKVTNKTDKEINFAGIAIPPKTQKDIREELVSQDEIKKIIEIGLHVKNTHSQYIISEKVKKTLKDVAPAGISVEHCAYPKEVITDKGNLSGSKQNKEIIEKLKEQYGDSILDDSEFKEKYPNEDIEAYRVEVE